jgi:hypothetical protein
MAIEFFNFSNDATFRAFEWFSESGHELADPDKMIRDAFETAESSGGHFAEEDICIVVRDKLAERLEKLLEELAANIGVDLGEGIGPVSPNPETLFFPLFASAISEIDCRLIAQAFLIRAGKWSPSTETPEVI